MDKYMDTKKKKTAVTVASHSIQRTLVLQGPTVSKKPDLLTAGNICECHSYILLKPLRVFFFLNT